MNFSTDDMEELAGMLNAGTLCVQATTATSREQLHSQSVSQRVVLWVRCGTAERLLLISSLSHARIPGVCSYNTGLAPDTHIHTLTRSAPWQVGYFLWLSKHKTHTLRMLALSLKLRHSVTMSLSTRSPHTTPTCNFHSPPIVNFAVPVWLTPIGSERSISASQWRSPLQLGQGVWVAGKI